MPVAPAHPRDPSHNSGFSPPLVEPDSADGPRVSTASQPALSPHPEERRLRRVSKDEATDAASWFSRRCGASSGNGIAAKSMQAA